MSSTVSNSMCNADISRPIQAPAKPSLLGDDSGACCLTPRIILHQLAWTLLSACCNQGEGLTQFPSGILHTSGLKMRVQSRHQRKSGGMLVLLIAKRERQGVEQHSILHQFSCLAGGVHLLGGGGCVSYSCPHHWVTSLHAKLPGLRPDSGCPMLGYGTHKYPMVGELFHASMNVPIAPMTLTASSSSSDGSARNLMGAPLWRLALVRQGMILR